MAVADTAPLAPEAGRVTTTSDLRRNLNLLRELSVTQFKLKYTGSALGYMWSLLKPAMNFAMLYVVFAVLLHAGKGTDNFPLQLLVGIVLWMFFSETTSTAMNSIVTSGALIKKAFFPRAIPVMAATMTAAMTFTINFLLILLVAGSFGRLEFGVQSLVILPLIVELYVLTLGLSLLLSALFVFYRDLGHIWEVLQQLLFYASAVVFPLSLLSNHPDLLKIASFSPLVQIIEDARHALVTTKVPWNGSVLGVFSFAPWVISALLLVVGAMVFRVCRTRFAEYL